MLTLLDFLWKRYQGKPWSNSGTVRLARSYIFWLIKISKENIFDPLGMKTSFLLTPDLKERAVNLAFRDSNGTLNPWANQIELIEQDPTKGMQKQTISPWGVWSLSWSVRVFYGGAGLYSSMRDYLKLLRHLMQIHGKLQYMSFPLDHYSNKVIVQLAGMSPMLSWKQKQYTTSSYQHYLRRQSNRFLNLLWVRAFHGVRLLL